MGGVADWAVAVCLLADLHADADGGNGRVVGYCFVAEVVGDRRGRPVRGDGQGPAPLLPCACPWRWVEHASYSFVAALLDPFGIYVISVLGYVLYYLVVASGSTGGWLRPCRAVLRGGGFGQRLWLVSWSRASRFL